MGCASSKEARRDRRRSPSPYFRSHSMPIHHFDSPRKPGSSSSSRHFVGITSSTLGSLTVDSEPDPDSGDELIMKVTSREVDVNKAKAWSEMINTKIPKTPTKTPNNEPETINTWELMEGLEEAIASSSPKPLWMQPDPGDSIVSDFDPDIISNFRKAMEELSPQHQCFLKSPEPARKSVVFVSSKPQCDCDDSEAETPKFDGIVKARVSAFQQKIDAKRGKKCPPNGEKKVVFYFTSLRGVQKTYEDCWSAKVILQGYGVKVDERDVSIHGGFKEELNGILGVGFGGGKLPRVFVNGKYLGGAEEVRRMHEAGELEKALEECEMAMVGKLGGGCEGCGDVRFVPCVSCSGSCKVFVEEEEDDDKEEEEEGVVVGGFRRCPDCNENGLVRCPYCL